MVKDKALTVTIIAAVMLAVIVVGLHLLKYAIAFCSIVGAFAAIGFVTASTAFYMWLKSDRSNLAPVDARPKEEPKQEQKEEPKEEYNLENIIDETKNDDFCGDEEE